MLGSRSRSSSLVSVVVPAPLVLTSSMLSPGPWSHGEADLAQRVGEPGIGSSRARPRARRERDGTGPGGRGLDFGVLVGQVDEAFGAGGGVDGVGQLPEAACATYREFAGVVVCIRVVIAALARAFTGLAVPAPPMREIRDY